VSDETAKLRELAEKLEHYITWPMVLPLALRPHLEQAVSALRSSAERVEKLQSQLSEATKPVTDDRVPICGSRSTLTVSRAIWDEAWHAYGKQYGFTESQHKRLLREGFYAEELDTLRPGWRPVDQALERLAREKDEATGALDAATESWKQSQDLVTTMLVRAEAAERRCQALEKELAELNGTPAKRFRWIMAELERRFPNPKPHMSNFSYERYALEQIDAALTGKPK
jgi:hypothetical protein